MTTNEQAGGEPLRYSVKGDHPIFSRQDKYNLSHEEATQLQAELIKAGYENVRMDATESRKGGAVSAPDLSQFEGMDREALIAEVKRLREENAELSRQSHLNDTDLPDAELIAALHDELFCVTDDIDSPGSGTILTKVQAALHGWSEETKQVERLRADVERLTRERDEAHQQCVKRIEENDRVLLANHALQAKIAELERDREEAKKTIGNIEAIAKDNSLHAMHRLRNILRASAPPSDAAMQTKGYQEQDLSVEPTMLRISNIPRPDEP